MAEAIGVALLLWLILLYLPQNKKMEFIFI